jgi:hypothetical protein
VLALFSRDNITTRHEYVAQTEKSGEAVNPTWSKPFVVDFDPEQEFKMSVYDAQSKTVPLLFPPLITSSIWLSVFYLRFALSLSLRPCVLGAHILS